MSAADSVHDCVRSGDVEAVKTFIATGGDINVADKHRRTPLHLAAWTGNEEMVSLLIRSKADLDKKAMDDFSALHFAVQSSAKIRDHVIACIRLLTNKSKGLLQQKVSKGGKNALHLAVLKGDEAVVRCLLECGINKLSKTSQGQTAIELAKTVSMRQVLVDFQPGIEKVDTIATAETLSNQTDSLNKDTADVSVNDVEEESLRAGDKRSQLSSPESSPVGKRARATQQDRS